MNSNVLSKDNLQCSGEGGGMLTVVYLCKMECTNKGSRLLGSPGSCNSADHRRERASVYVASPVPASELAINAQAH